MLVHCTLGSVRKYAIMLGNIEGHFFESAIIARSLSGTCNTASSLRISAIAGMAGAMLKSSPAVASVVKGGRVGSLCRHRRVGWPVFALRQVCRKRAIRTRRLSANSKCSPGEMVCMTFQGSVRGFSLLSETSPINPPSRLPDAFALGRAYDTGVERDTMQAVVRYELDDLHRLVFP